MNLVKGTRMYQSMERGKEQKKTNPNQQVSEDPSWVRVAWVPSRRDSDLLQVALTDRLVPESKLLRQKKVMHL